MIHRFPSIIILFTKSFSLLEEHRRIVIKMDNYDYVYYGEGLTDYENEENIEEKVEKES